MKTIIAGSRTVTDIQHLYKAIAECGWPITEVISGRARGADRLGEWWAARNSVPLVRFNADWEQHGRKAGILRNAQMLERGEALIALWDGRSNGTRHMIRIAREKGIKVHVEIVLIDDLPQSRSAATYQARQGKA